MFKFKFSPAHTVPAILLNVFVTMLLLAAIVINKYPPTAPAEEQDVYYVDMLDYSDGSEHYSSVDFATTSPYLAEVTFEQQKTIISQSACSREDGCDLDSTELRLWHMDTNFETNLVRQAIIKY